MYMFHFSQVTCLVYIKRRANLINKLQQRFNLSCFMRKEQ